MALRDERSWEAKARTLEFFVLHEGGHKPRELIENPLAGEQVSLPRERSSIKVRLLRYYRAGLLDRRKAGRGYEYTITMRGEMKLLYLWQAGGYLDSARAVTELERKELIYRHELKILLLEKHILEIKQRSRVDKPSTSAIDQPYGKAS